jgi:hypothetical protein
MESRFMTLGVDLVDQKAADIPKIQGFPAGRVRAHPGLRHGSRPMRSARIVPQADPQDGSVFRSHTFRPGGYRL